MNALAWSLRLYVVGVVVATVPAFALAVSMLRPITTMDLVSAAFLLALGWLAQRHPVHLGPKLKVTVDDAPFFAAALLLSPVVAMGVAALSKVLGAPAGMPHYNRLFNAAAAVLSTGAAAMTFGALANG